MHPAQFHIIDRDDRVRTLAGVSEDFGGYLSDAYDALSTPDTKTFLSALRHGTTLVGMETMLRTVEWASVASTTGSIPFRSKIWQVHTMSEGTLTLDPAPYRILGVRTSAAEEGGATIPEAGPIDPEDVLVTQTRWLDVDYDSSTGTVTAQGSDSGYNGRVWVPEQRFENPAIRSHAAQSHNLRLHDLGPTYPPPHLFYLTRLVEQVRQDGLQPGRALQLAQAAYGVPFAYVGGTIDGYTAENGRAWARIDTGDGIAASFLPNGATGAEGDLLSAGTTVDAFDTLVTGATGLSVTSGQNRAFETPIAVDSTTPTSNTLHFTSDPGLSAGDALEFQILNSGYDSFLVVTATNANDVTVRGEVPPIAGADWAYVVPRSSSADGAGGGTITVSSPFSSSPIDQVESILRDALPPTLSVSVSEA